MTKCFAVICGLGIAAAFVSGLLAYLEGDYARAAMNLGLVSVNQLGLILYVLARK